MCGALAWLKQSPAKTVLGIIPDTGANYLDQIYNDDWLAQKGVKLLSREELDERLNIKPVLDIEDCCREQETEAPAEVFAVAAGS